MPFQLAVAEFLKDETVFTSLSARFEALRDLFISELDKTAFRALPTYGSYFVLADYAAISQLPDVEFCEWLTREAKVSAIPVSVFNTNKEDKKVVRFCFGKKDDTLRAGLARLQQIPAMLSA
jgi:methionine aminotransferase